MKKLWNQYSEPIIGFTCAIIILSSIFGMLYFIGLRSQEEMAKNGHYYANGTWIYVIDGCEYLKGQNYTHKENCTNSIHRIK